MKLVSSNIISKIAGYHGKGAIMRTLTGSVAHYVMNHARVPVVVCQQKDVEDRKSEDRKSEEKKSEEKKSEERSKEEEKEEDKVDAEDKQEKDK